MQRRVKNTAATKYLPLKPALAAQHFAFILAFFSFFPPWLSVQVQAALQAILSGFHL